MKKKFLFLAIAIPILAQTNITQINQSKALFISQGELILTNSYSHLIVNFDLNILQNDLESLRKMQHSLQLITPTSDWSGGIATVCRLVQLCLSAVTCISPNCVCEYLVKLSKQ